MSYNAHAHGLAIHAHLSQTITLSFSKVSEPLTSSSSNGNGASSSSNGNGGSNLSQENATTAERTNCPHLHLGFYCNICSSRFQYGGQEVVVIRQGMDSSDRPVLLQDRILHAGPLPTIYPGFVLMDTPSPGIIDNLPEPRVPIHPDDGQNPPPQPPYVLTVVKPYVRLGDQIFAKCIDPDCPERDTSPEVAVVHPACIKGLELINSLPRMRQGLWQVLTWSAPWKDAPLQFFTTESRLSPVLANVGCENMQHDFPIPTRTRPEAKQSEAMEEWILARQLDLYACLQQMRPGPLISVSLARLPNWKRGQGNPKPHYPPHEDDPGFRDYVALAPYIRISIDAYGIFQIERIATPKRTDPLSAERTDNKAFMVIEAAAYANQVKMQFMNGLARMEIIGGSPRLQTWDTPTPPSRFDGTRLIYPGCITAGNGNTPRARFFSIKFQDTVGITFVYHPSMGLVDIQQHRKGGSAAYVRPLLDFPADSLVYIYLPTKGDTNIGYMIFQMKDGHPTLACPRFVIAPTGVGTVNIGSKYVSKRSSKVLNRPQQLFFKRTERKAIDFIGTYWDGVEVAGTHRPSAVSLGNIDNNPPFYSFAPLRLARVFDIYRYSNGCLRCLVITYNTGARRMLGDYRIGQMPKPETFTDPGMLCFNGEHLGVENGQPLRSGMLMTCGDLGPHVHENAQNWRCYPMQHNHVIELFFTAKPAHRVNIRTRYPTEEWPTDQSTYGLFCHLPLRHYIQDGELRHVAV